MLVALLPPYVTGICVGCPANVAATMPAAAA
jgi:hypothetical protein